MDWGSGVAPAVAARSPSLCGLTPQVGITLHYSSLSTLLWMGVKARVLHKELTWREPPPQEGDAAPPAPRPMLRYLPPAVSFARVKGSQGGWRPPPSVLPGWRQGGYKVLGEHSPKTEEAQPQVAPGCPRPWRGCILRAFQGLRGQGKEGLQGALGRDPGNPRGTLTSVLFQVREQFWPLSLRTVSHGQVPWEPTEPAKN